MTYHHEKVKKAIVARTTEHLLATGWPRFWMFLACSAAIAGWWSLSTTLRAVHSFGLRYGLCAAGAYVIWFGVVCAWRLNQPSIDTAKFVELSEDGRRVERFYFDEWRRKRREFAQELYDAASREMMRDPKGALAAILAVLVMGGPLVGIWLISFSPQFLAELLVDSGKIRHPTKYAPTPRKWHQSLLARTGWFAAALVLHYALLASIFQWAQPNAVGLADLPIHRR